MAQNHGRKHLTFVAVPLLGIISVVCYFAFESLQRHTSDSQDPPAPPGEIPSVNLIIQRVATRGGELTSQGYFSDATKLVKSGCPMWVADTKGHVNTNNLKPKDNCPLYTTWQVKRHPIVASLFVEDAAAIEAYLSDDDGLATALKQPLGAGSLGNWIEMLGIKTPALEKTPLAGFLFRTLAQQLLSREGRIDFDAAHGRAGTVLSFQEDLATEAMVNALAFVAKRRFEILGSPCSVWEFNHGPEKLFASKCRHRVYLGLSLSGLINVMDQETPAPPSPTAGAAFSVSWYADAMLKGARGFVGSDPGFGITTSFTLKDGRLAPLQTQSPMAPLWRGMAPQVDPRVYASIPKGISAFMVTSHDLDAFVSDEQLMAGIQKFQLPFGAKPHPQAATALLVDLNHQDKALTQVGVVLIPGDPGVVDTWVEPLAHILGETVRSKLAYCGKGQVILMASSPLLLTRMREACEGSSQAWSGHHNLNMPHKSSLYLTPGGIAKEMFLAGGGGEIPKGKPDKPLTTQQSQLAASKEQMTQETLAYLKTWPHWLLANAGDESQNQTAHQNQKLTWSLVADKEAL